MLSGKSPDGRSDEGPQVCACFDVRLGVIRDAVNQGARTTEDIGVALRAGRNCGSCLPELKRILEQARVLLPASVK